MLYQRIDTNIVKITLNGPEKRNDMDNLTQEELWDAFVQADPDEDVNVIVLSAAGKDFSAGYDISGKGEKARGPVLGKVAQSKLTGVEREIKILGYIIVEQAKAIRNVSKPTVAMVQGRCIAGASILVAMCDLIVASEDARFIDPVSGWGSAGVEVLHHPYSFGFRRAKEMLFTGDPVTAQEAKELGFVSRVVSEEQLEEETMKLACRIA
ncbi:enoyl-CoA hydratase-related protein [Chloroflexota bacterium]